MGYPAPSLVPPQAGGCGGLPQCRSVCDWPPDVANRTGNRVPDFCTLVHIQQSHFTYRIVMCHHVSRHVTCRFLLLRSVLLDVYITMVSMQHSSVSESGTLQLVCALCVHM